MMVLSAQCGVDDDAGNDDDDGDSVNVVGQHRGICVYVLFTMYL